MIKMFTFNEIVKATDIWPTAENHIDRGEIQGLVRGYNIEIKCGNVVDWLAASWFYGTPETEYNDDFHTAYFSDMSFEPTGRICFRGYGVLEYDYEERDEFVRLLSDEDVQNILDNQNQITEADFEPEW